jgi:hypothetical protein
MFAFRLLSAFKNRRERRSGRVPQPATKARTRLTLESLEDRCLMSARVVDPPIPVSVPTAFAVGIGPGMQIDFFEVDRAGQVFAQPVMNLFGHFGDTVFINSHVVIPNLIPQDGSPPLITVSGSGGQRYPGLLTNPSDPNVSSAAITSIANSLPPLIDSILGFNTSGLSGNGSGQTNTFPVKTTETLTGDIGFSFTVYNSDGTIAGQSTADGTLTVTMARVDENSPWTLDSATATLKQHSPVTATIMGEQIPLDLSGTYSGVTFTLIPDGGVKSLSDGQPIAFELQQVDQAGNPLGNDLIVAGTFNNSSQFNGMVVNPGQEAQIVGQTIPGFEPTNPPGFTTNPNLIKYSVALRQNGVQLQEQP